MTISDLAPRVRLLLCRFGKRVHWIVSFKRLAAFLGRNSAGHYRVENYANGESYAATNKRLIVCLTHESPWPIQAGNQYRIARMIGWFLTEGYDLLLVVVPIGDVPLSDDEQLAVFKKYDNVLLCYRRGLIHNSIKTLDLSFDQLDGQPIQSISARSKSIDRADNSPLHEYEMQNCHDALIGVAQEIAQQSPDAIWYINYGFMSRVVDHLPKNVITIVDTHDVFSQKPDKVFSYGIKGEKPITADEERRMLLRPNAVLAIQAKDAAELRRLVPEQTVLTVGVDFDFIAVTPPPATPGILMVASANPLNTKGLADFLQFAWPTIKDAVRNVELVLVGLIGRAASTDDPQITLAGTIDSLHPYYEHARVVINPAIAGTGLKIKAVESISHMRPIVTWPAGADGIGEPLIKLCYVVQNWRQFADTVIKLLTTSLDSALSSADIAAIRAGLSSQAAYHELGTWLANSTRSN